MTLRKNTQWKGQQNFIHDHGPKLINVSKTSFKKLCSFSLIPNGSISRCKHDIPYIKAKLAPLNPKLRGSACE
jgi:hypothetical protein